MAAILFAAPAHAGRGSDGEVRILFWQAVSSMNPYLSGGSKEVYAASIVIEPLAGFDENGKMVPRIAADIPTRENGGVSADGTSITWTIRDGLQWSDGTTVSAEDVVFTWRYCTAPGGGCAQKAKFDGVRAVEAVDRRTVKITFGEPVSYPYAPFVGALSPVIQQAQFKDCLGERAPSCTQANFGPIGTGPFLVKDFKANDVVTFTANPHYRDPAKPAFASVVLKGGGDAAAAARAVLETGEYDFAWNTIVEPEVLEVMLKAGKGTIAGAFGTTVERIHLNPFAVDPALGDKRSTQAAGPHPALSDPKVRRALSIAIDRDILVEAGYGAGGRATCNLVPAPPAFASSAVDWCLKQDIEGAKRLLDEAGWVPGPDGIRAKDGVKLSFLYQTSTNSVRQGTQALVKEWWHQIGVETELRNIPASVYFGSDPASPDTFKKFYADIEMYASGFETTDPAKFLADFRCDKIPSPADGWQGGNIARVCDPSYDKLTQTLNTAKGDERAAIIRQLNDSLVNGGYIIPIINRGEPSAIANALIDAKINPWDSQLWNIEEWKRRR
ncbi:peptide ABC transporter substrate-binding protein [Rhizobium sp. SSA_523]|uniref:peptide ABC transporter substrate-binding protein n=1 Tax=Rhizobium sp. SSA_523 TaxID=2952477 RepID=UPI0020911CA4|nr:peptide ABC transporter substrate-binding protein [Rhizobium sp. SSA_523]MCO5731783.1 peptide ABC transporter substrate-binding protein [Rhizobium sp. SSA_523]WKC22848.1 peptide ABC transporter substrate-binding protein [Rhizobium sp. SSA_523]